MKTKVITVDTSTIEGIKKAEKIQMKGYDLYPEGYLIVLNGSNIIKFIPPKTK